MKEGYSGREIQNGVRVFFPGKEFLKIKKRQCDLGLINPRASGRGRKWRGGALADGQETARDMARQAVSGPAT